MEGWKKSKRQYLTWTSDGVSAAREKSFDNLQVTGSVFSSHAIVFKYLKVVKSPGRI